MTGGGDDDQGRRNLPSAYPIPLVPASKGAGADAAGEAEQDEPGAAEAHASSGEGSPPGRVPLPSAYPIPLVPASRGARADAARGLSPPGLPAELGRAPAAVAPRPVAPRPVAPPILRVRDLTVSIVTDGGVLRALDGVSFDVPRGGTVALVGESGCGKTLTALSILRLLPEPHATLDAGSIELEGRELMTLSERDMRAVRGGRAAMVFQEPMTSLNPVFTVGAQVAEAIRLHRRVSRRDARRAAIEVLRKVGLPEPEVRADCYPHELSGGMRQRVMIAIALAPGPALLLADEPTTALDMTTQAQILNLLEELRDELAMSVLLIAHDLAVVAALADEVVVMYAGVVVEQGPAARVLSAPAHPYTRALLRSIPGGRPHRVRGQRARPLPALGGALPDLRDPPVGCRFADRCGDVLARCRAEAPALEVAAPGELPQRARCFLVGVPAPGAPREGAA